MLCHFLNIFARSNILIPLTFTKKSHIYQTTADRKLQNPLKSTLCTCERWNKPHTNKGPPNTPPSTLQLCHTLPLPPTMRTIVTTTTTLSTIILTSVLIIGKSCWQIVERGVGVERNKDSPVQFLLVFFFFLWSPFFCFVAVVHPIEDNGNENENGLMSYRTN